MTTAARILALTAASLGPATAFGDDEFDIPGLDAPDLRGDALVWEDATFHLEPWDTGAAGVRFASFGRGRREEVGRAMPVRIVDSTRRTFIEVEVPNRADCTWRRLGADPRIDALRLFVRRDDLAPALIKPFVAQYGDGTKIKIGIGAPVMPTTNGDYLVAVKADKLRLAIPHGSVGYVYKAGKITEPDLPAGKLVRIDRNATAKVGDETFAIRSSWIAPAPDKKTDVALVRWTTRCLDMVVSVPANTLRATEPPRATSTPTPPPVVGSGVRIPPGAPLASIGGRELAVASAPIAVTAPSAGTACFDARFALFREDEMYMTQNRTIRLCASTSVLEGSTQVVAPVDTDGSAAPPDVAKPPGNAKRTAKGVSYRVLRVGTGGAKPTAQSQVMVHYSGWTTDGALFDSSVKRGTPALFSLNAVIAGWTDGLQVMSVGDKVRFWIPEELAYKGAPGRPKGMLVFDVELLEIK